MTYKSEFIKPETCMNFSLSFCTAVLKRGTRERSEKESRRWGRREEVRGGAGGRSHASQTSLVRGMISGTKWMLVREKFKPGTTGRLLRSKRWDS